MLSFTQLWTRSGFTSGNISVSLWDASLLRENYLPLLSCLLSTLQLHPIAAPSPQGLSTSCGPTGELCLWVSWLLSLYPEVPDKPSWWATTPQNLVKFSAQHCHHLTMLSLMAVSSVSANHYGHSKILTSLGWCGSVGWASSCKP